MLHQSKTTRNTSQTKLHSNQPMTIHSTKSPRQNISIKHKYKYDSTRYKNAENNLKSSSPYIVPNSVQQQSQRQLTSSKPKYKFQQALAEQRLYSNSIQQSQINLNTFNQENISKENNQTAYSNKYKQKQSHTPNKNQGNFQTQLLKKSPRDMNNAKSIQSTDHKQIDKKSKNFKQKSDRNLSSNNLNGKVQEQFKNYNIIQPKRANFVPRSTRILSEQQPQQSIKQIGGIMTPQQNQTIQNNFKNMTGSQFYQKLNIQKSERLKSPQNPRSSTSDSKNKILYSNIKSYRRKNNQEKYQINFNQKEYQNSQNQAQLSQVSQNQKPKIQENMEKIQKKILLRNSKRSINNKKSSRIINNSNPNSSNNQNSNNQTVDSSSQQQQQLQLQQHNIVNNSSQQNSIYSNEQVSYNNTTNQTSTTNKTQCINQQQNLYQQQNNNSKYKKAYYKRNERVYSLDFNSENTNLKSQLDQEKIQPHSTNSQHHNNFSKVINPYETSNNFKQQGQQKFNDDISTSSKNSTISKNNQKNIFAQKFNLNQFNENMKQIENFATSELIQTLKNQDKLHHTAQNSMKNSINSNTNKSVSLRKKRYNITNKYIQNSEVYDLSKGHDSQTNNQSQVDLQNNSSFQKSSQNQNSTLEQQQKVLDSYSGYVSQSQENNVQSNQRTNSQNQNNNYQSLSNNNSYNSPHRKFRAKKNRYGKNLEIKTDNSVDSQKIQNINSIQTLNLNNINLHQEPDYINESVRNNNKRQHIILNNSNEIQTQKSQNKQQKEIYQDTKKIKQNDQQIQNQINSKQIQEEQTNIKQVQQSQLRQKYDNTTQKQEVIKQITQLKSFKLPTERRKIDKIDQQVENNKDKPNKQQQNTSQNEQIKQQKQYLQQQVQSNQTQKKNDDSENKISKDKNIKQNSQTKISNRTWEEILDNSSFFSIIEEKNIQKQFGNQQNIEKIENIFSNDINSSNYMENKMLQQDQMVQNLVFCKNKIIKKQPTGRENIIEEPNINNQLNNKQYQSQKNDRIQRKYNKQQQQYKKQFNLSPPINNNFIPNQQG
ncbi:hypothetical protein PPERSA_01123 [Pseudocohnilembus persalinus]|uniref:Uncharacterized protein n=1 Tax=Pseudocohnilembus persalinus TaxID=266149 RepID=A0A0V0QVD5_PSEPJ|nr:hypothetical protein PPERSA_01123 [Pseudocohnilembus persalinus]|eukprot:KRX06045.1 hypothetical protein PPERSA_01123 [Pseudocohnilembus persalinus]